MCEVLNHRRIGPDKIFGSEPRCPSVPLVVKFLCFLRLFAAIPSFLRVLANPASPQDRPARKIVHTQFGTGPAAGESAAS